MKNSRLTFNSSTNFTLPIGVYQVLQSDAYYYGFMKNEKPNICGFLNSLIPELSDYQEDLFRELLKYNIQGYYKKKNEAISKTTVKPKGKGK